MLSKSSWRCNKLSSARQGLPGGKRLGRAVAGQEPGMLPVDLGPSAQAVGPVVHTQCIGPAYLPALGGGKDRQRQLMLAGQF